MSQQILQSLLLREEKIICGEIQKKYILSESLSYSSTDLHLINTNLLLTNEENVAYKAHRALINNLLTIYFEHKHSEWLDPLKKIFTFSETEKLFPIVQYHINQIPDLLEQIHVIFLNSEFCVNNGKILRKKSKHHLKEIGAVYTLKTITNEIVTKCISNAESENQHIETLTCLDFACGTGRFYFEALSILKEKYNLPLEKIIAQNLFAIDIDEIAINILRVKITSHLENLTTEIIEALQSNVLHRNALLPKVGLLNEEYNNFDFSIDFKSQISDGGFDIIFSNPPYYLLKINKKDDTKNLNEYYYNLQNKIEREITFFRTSGFYNHSIEGMLNYYQLSIEMIIKLVKEKGEVGIICPSSIFADLTSSKLRKYILTSNKIRFIRYYPESERLFDNVAQSTVIFFLQKGKQTDNILIEYGNDGFTIDLYTIKSIFNKSLEVPMIDKMGWSILSKISKYKKLKDFGNLRNRRGELDLTLFKSSITKEETGWRLVRGNMITEEGILNKKTEYVDLKIFLKRKSQDYITYDYNRVRLVCQQISNVDSLKRLKFVFSEENDILGNSCNYISTTSNFDDLYKLYYLLNSKLLNWRFKITSSNNHINNYELDELPIIDLENIHARSLLNSNDIDIEICKLYGLSTEEIQYVLNVGPYINNFQILEDASII